jgi:DNA adenine methylase
MRYLGGKSKIRKQIANYLKIIRKPNQPYWEPFVGGGWVLMEMSGQPIYASDKNEALIFMWRKLQQGWQPPSTLTEETFNEIRRGGFDAALTAFASIGCAFAGKWGAGYAKEGKRGECNFADVAKRSLANKLAQMDAPFFFVSDFLSGWPPDYECLIYCDPPYRGTEKHSITGPFDSDQFWDRVRQLQARGHTVVVSEYQAPSDFICVLEMPYQMCVRSGSGEQEKRIERLFRLKTAENADLRQRRG